MELQQAVTSFLTAKEAEGRTPQTIMFYRDRLAHLAFQTVEEITPDGLRKLILAYTATHNTGGTHALYRAVKAFLFWLEEEELLPGKNPIRKVKPPKVDRPPVRGASMDELTALLMVASVRDRAILLVMFDSGCRAGEVVRFQLTDLDGGRLIVTKAKSRKPRVVFIGKRSQEALGAYLASRKDLCPSLFATDDGKALAREGLRQILRRLCKRVGIRNLSAHKLRHAMALAYTRAGGDLATLQGILGHSSPVITRGYLLLEASDLQAAFERATPSESLQ